VLIEHGGGVNAPNYYRSTPLHVAAESGHLGMVWLLLECGPDRNMQGFAGRTALRRASIKGLRDTVQLLLDYGSVQSP